MEELAAGSGPAARAGDLVSVRYTGKRTDGTVFDSSPAGAPFRFYLGSEAVIPGFDAGVAGMRVGGKRKITVPPEMARHGRFQVSQVLGQAPVVFEVEMLEITGR
jgi:peptidylprolyl isomerase/FKBP-type peptidyl-prolyl cis-trans isomerase FkpA